MGTSPSGSKQRSLVAASELGRRGAPQDTRTLQRIGGDPATCSGDFKPPPPAFPSASPERGRRWRARLCYYTGLLPTGQPIWSAAAYLGQNGGPAIVVVQHLCLESCQPRCAHAPCPLHLQHPAFDGASDTAITRYAVAVCKPLAIKCADTTCLALRVA